MSIYKLKSDYAKAGVEDLVYSTKERTLRIVPFCDLLSEVMLQTNDTPDSLILSLTESIHLNFVLAKRFSKSTCSSTAERSKKCNESEKSEDVRVDQDGSLHMIVEPCVSDENVRRSTRKRTVRVITDS